MTKILSAIHADHRNYSILLSLLNTDIDQLAQGKGTDFIRLYDIMNYMTNYPDVHHHPVEEIIFDCLKENTPEVKEQIDKLVDEHRKLAELGKILKDNLQHVTSGSIISRDTIINSAHDYYHLLTSHINFEESKLFPLAESRLNEDDWNKIQLQTDKVNDPLFGSVVDEQFAELFKRISTRKSDSE